MSDKWVALATARLQRLTADFAGELEGVDFTLYEELTHAPPHLGFRDNIAAWSIRVRGGEVTISRERPDSPDLSIRGEYQFVLPCAQAVGPHATARMSAQVRHLFGDNVIQIMGQPPVGRLADIFGDLHDYLARRTVENPDIEHRIARQRLETQVQEVAELGYTVIRNAITSAFADELREKCLEEILMHKRQVNKSGRLDSMGLLTRGRAFEEIAQHPTLRTVMETALGAGMIIQTISCAMKGPGPSAVPIHADYPAVPDPYPEYPLVGVAVWALDDWKVESGPTWIIPGSHRHRRAPRPEDSREGAVPILLNKGDVTFFTQGVWHWQGDRTEPGHRVSIHNGYQRCFLRAVDDLSNLDEVLHRNSPVLSTLTGQDDMFEKSNWAGHDMERAAYMAALSNWRPGGEQRRHARRQEAES
jgi:ectoine hydroxylase-related dioxygenase (phytanoyl-CoA dioxygenase family)